MENELLQAPGNEDYSLAERVPSSYRPKKTFQLTGTEQRHYQQQYGDMYFCRLAKLKPAVEQAAKEAWAELEVAGEVVQKKDRVLDVRQGELCWVVGTIYMDMPLKPNILEDISKDQWIGAPPPREKYLSPSGQDQTMLEDESGRLHLVGALLETSMLVTGCIVAVMGTENSNGDFEIIDMKVPDLARQPQRWEEEDAEFALANGTGKKRKIPNGHPTIDSKVALISGLEISGDEADSLTVDLLMEFLLGEAGGDAEKDQISRISRLIIAGNSLAIPSNTKDEALGKKAAKKYGYDASAYNPAPTTHLDNFLATLLPSLPITLMPGANDPANVAMPQQPIHTAMLPRSRAYTNAPSSDDPSWFDSTTNPWQGDVDGWRFLGNGGQPVDDIFKYVEGIERLDLMEHLLRWRNGAPTAPDTLWSYPYQDEEPFVMDETPHVFFVGNQPKFETTTITGPAGQVVRIIAVPKFKESGQVVLVSTSTLEIEVLKFNIHNNI